MRCPVMIEIVFWFLSFVAGLAVGLVFLVAGAGKLLSPSETIRAAEAYGLPPGIARWIGNGLPWIEVVVAFSLITSVAALYSAFVAILLLLIFSGAQMSALLRGLDVPCGCFGSLSE